MSEEDGPALIGTATRGHVAGYRVEVWPAVPDGWDIYYFPPTPVVGGYHSHGEDWAEVLDYCVEYRVVWEGGYALQD
jgi:hypothetical protein